MNFVRELGNHEGRYLVSFEPLEVGREPLSDAQVGSGVEIGFVKILPEVSIGAFVNEDKGYAFVGNEKWELLDQALTASYRRFIFIERLEICFSGETKAIVWRWTANDILYALKDPTWDGLDALAHNHLRILWNIITNKKGSAEWIQRIVKNSKVGE